MPEMESQPITAGELLTEQQARDIRAALARLGTTQKAFAEEVDISRSGMRQVLSRRRTCYPRYAPLFNDLLEEAGFTLAEVADE